MNRKSCCKVLHQSLATANGHCFQIFFKNHVFTKPYVRQFLNSEMNERGRGMNELKYSVFHKVGTVHKYMRDKRKQLIMSQWHKAWANENAESDSKAGKVCYEFHLHVRGIYQGKNTLIYSKITLFSETS